VVTRFVSFMKSAIVMVRDNVVNKWTWSSTPPMLIGKQSRVFATPAR